MYDRTAEADGSTGFWVMMLRSYLERFRICKNKERKLLRRKQMIEEYKKAPIKSTVLTGMPGGGGDRDSLPVSILVDIENIEERIDAQMADSLSTLDTIMNIIDQLPEKSDEREVIERKYIDLQSENGIVRDLHISRSKLYRDVKKGLGQLIEYGWVMDVLERYRSEVEAGTVTMPVPIEEFEEEMEDEEDG